MTSKIIFVAGLPGSGKTTLINSLLEGKNRFYHSDWGWKFPINEDGTFKESFNDDYRFEQLLDQIKQGVNLVIDGGHLCNHRFLLEGEYHLKLNFPGIEIERYYFENNPKNAIANVLYRSSLHGDYWVRREGGDLLFVGKHHILEGPNKGRRSYEFAIESIQRLSNNYTIPSTYTPLQIKVQDEKFYQGWRALIKEE